MAIEIPDIDPRDEEELVASAIDALPATITDRGRSAPEVQLVEACGALYSAVTWAVNAWPAKLRAQVLTLLGYAPDAAQPATATLTFVAGGGGATIPAGTIIRAGLGADAPRFATTAELILGASATGTVTATCTTGGASTNVAAGTLTRQETPVAGVVSVTNLAAASGGQDEEALAALEARVPALLRAGDRVVTGEDAEQRALAVAGVERVVALGERGALTLHVLLSDLNAAYLADFTNAGNAATRAAVKAAVVAATIPGVAVVVAQPTIKLVHLNRVEVQLVAGHASATVRAAILAAFTQALSALAVYGADGSTVVQEGWEWGASLYRNELIALFDGLAGVRRVGRIYIRESVDYGATWGAEVELDTVAAWANGAPNTTFGLLGAGLDGAHPLTLDLL